MVFEGAGGSVNCGALVPNRTCIMPPKRQQQATAEAVGGSPAAAPTQAEPEQAGEPEPEPVVAPAPTAEEGAPEASPVSLSGASGGKYGPIMQRRLKKFLAIVEADEGWE